eukprot:TRINITY_DN4688_c0_g1_i1.p1 TRINITY_DN4688_c0_g1~~TRINITY_DN4688_c0_g1_i1.p1  ORF type:complete len:423 (+),score=86.27 TRINITY_DN4688_c0_g1_i1:113-1381(+)
MLHRATRLIPKKTFASAGKYFSRSYHVDGGKLHEVVIVSFARTPIGCLGGALSTVPGVQLQSTAIKAAVSKAGIQNSEVTEALIGNVISAGVGQAPARQAAKLAGLNDETVCTTINKVCASGMKAVMYGAQSIMLGQHNTVVAGGFESMSNVPYYLEKARSGYRLGHGQLVDGLLKDGLTDSFDNHHMGMCAEHCAKHHSISRKEQDEYAIEAYKRTALATEKGWFREEIVDVTVSQGKTTTVVKEDEEFKKTNFDKIPSLKPVFTPEGTVTAANASKLNDGAAALVLMSRKRAHELGLKPVARILGWGDAEQRPIEFPTAPAKAIPVALRSAGVNQKDIDYWEINEAFSVVALANSKLLGIDLSKLNVFGGGVSLGHPIGCSGARIIGTLISVLNTKGGKLGVASICNGGGGASAIVIEKL